MPTTSGIQITLDLRNPQLDDEALEKLTQSLRRKILDLQNFQQINYPILWGGQHERLCIRALMLPTPQEVVEYFFICQSLALLRHSGVKP
ncbi:hypothetical protein FACHB389_20585 [Nostoc calcicola FACHB-389]|nr:hypothetical protein [Nostoc sp. EkiNYC01]OKH31917.1 hypothetical protein FACHB389_20585 [Nostoc calcicola FACHB-389]